MNRRSFLMLAAATAVAVVLSLTLGQNGTDRQPVDQKFLPELSGVVNNVERVVHRGGDGIVATLERGESDWTVSELDGYPADWPVVRATLSALADANVLEFKTSNPAYHVRLGVEEPGQQGAASELLELHAPGQSWSVIAGNVPELQFGQYVRLSDQDQAILIDQELDLPAEAVDWADRQILDIGAAQVAGIQIRHQDGEIVSISKVSADDANFTLDTLPEGRELQSTYTLNSAAGVLAMLELDAVQRDEGAGLAPVAECEVTLFSGLKITAEIIEMENANPAGDESENESLRWLRIRAGLADQESDDPGLKERLDEIQQRTSGWLYRISSTRMDTMVRRNDNFLKPLSDP